jgi:hypothetical protein
MPESSPGRVQASGALNNKVNDRTADQVVLAMLAFVRWEASPSSCPTGSSANHPPAYGTRTTNFDMDPSQNRGRRGWSQLPKALPLAMRSSIANMNPEKLAVCHSGSCSFSRRAMLCQRLCRRRERLKQGAPRPWPAILARLCQQYPGEPAALRLSSLPFAQSVASARPSHIMRHSCILDQGSTAWPFINPWTYAWPTRR